MKHVKRIVLGTMATKTGAKKLATNAKKYFRYVSVKKLKSGDYSVRAKVIR